MSCPDCFHEWERTDDDAYEVTCPECGCETHACPADPEEACPICWGKPVA